MATKTATKAKRRYSPETTLNLLSQQIEFHKGEIAKHRDVLRKLISDAESVAETCDEAVSSLENAVDSLSQYV